MSEIVYGLKIKADGSGVVGEFRKAEKEVRKLGNSTDKLSAQNKKLSSSATQLKTELGGASSGLVSMRNSMLAGGGIAAGLLAVATAMKAVIVAGMEMQKIQSILKFSTGNLSDSMSFLRAESERLGLDLQSTSKDFGKFASAARGTSLEGQAAKDIFSSLMEATTTLGLSSDETSGALNAMQQMISKGKVSSEELNQQLGERLPGAFQMAARAMKLTTSELSKQLELGKVLATDFLPKLAAEMHKTFAGSAMDAAGNLRQQLNRLGNATFELKAAIADSGLMTVVSALTAALTRLVKEQAEGVKGINSWRDSLARNAKSMEGLDIKIADARETLADYQKEVERINNAKGMSKFFTVFSSSLRHANTGVDLFTKKLNALYKQRNDRLFKPKQDKPKEIVNVQAKQQVDVLKEQLRLMQFQGKELAVQTALSRAKLDLTTTEGKEVAKLSAEIFKMTEARKQVVTSTKDQSAAGLSLIVSLHEEIRLRQFSGRELEIQNALSQAHNQNIYDQDTAIRQLTGSLYDMQAAEDAVATSRQAALDALDKAESLLQQKVTAREKMLQQAADANTKAWQKSYEQVQSTTADFLKGLYDGSINTLADLGQRMKDWFINTLIEMQSQALAKPIMLAIGGGSASIPGVASAAGADAGGGGLSGGLDMLGQLGGLGSTISNWATSGFSLTASSGGIEALSQAGSLMADGFMTEGMSMAAGSIGAIAGAGMVGYMAGGALSDLIGTANKKAAKNLTAAGAAIGMMTPLGPLGAVIGGGLGFAASGFFRGDAQQTGGGVNLAVDGTNASGSVYKDYFQKGGWFQSDKRWKTEEGLSTDALAPMQAALTSVRDNLTAWGDSINVDLVAKLDTFKTTYSGSADGIAQAMQTIVESMYRVSLPGLDAFSRAGETVDQTLARIVVSFDLINNLKSGINKSIDALQAVDVSIAVVAESSLKASTVLLGAFAPQLTTLSNSFSDLANKLGTTSDMQSRIDLLGKMAQVADKRYAVELQLMSTIINAGKAAKSNLSTLKEQISGDLNVGAGSRSGAAISADIQASTQSLFESFANGNVGIADYIQAAQSSIDTLSSLRTETLAYNDTQQALLLTLQDASATLAGTISDLRLTNVSPAQALEQRQADFKALLSQASGQSGDALASTSNQLSALIQPMLDEARNVFASGSGYQNIFNSSLASLESIQSRLDSQASNISSTASSESLLSQIDASLSVIDNTLTLSDTQLVTALDVMRNQQVGLLQSIDSKLAKQMTAITGPDPRTPAMSLTFGTGFNKLPSHATGLANVPYDNYAANLHAGEAVIDAQTMAGIRRYGIAARQTSTASDGISTAQIQQIVQAVLDAAQQNQNITVQVVTDQGAVIKEQVFTDLKTRSGNGEIMLDAKGVG